MKLATISGRVSCRILRQPFPVQNACNGQQSNRPGPISRLTGKQGQLLAEVAEGTGIDVLSSHLLKLLNMATPDVFICHTGAQKRDFVDILRILLEDYHRLTVFVDEWALRRGVDAPATMQQNLDNAAVAVVVLSPEFLTKKHPLLEVRRIVEQQKAQPGKQQICLIFHGIDIDKCCKMDVEGALTEYQQDVVDLCKITGIREDQTRSYQGELARDAVKTVITFLKHAGRLPLGYGGGPQCHLTRMHTKLFGREKHVKDLLQLLQTERKAAVVAGPGEGKTALATIVAQTMFDGGELPGGAYLVDLSIPGISANMCQQMASQLILQLYTMEGTAGLKASNSWDTLLPWLRGSNQPMLIVLENVESVLQNADDVQVLMDIVNQLLQCRFLRLLVNARVKALQELPSIILAELDSSSAVALLRNRAGKDVTWEASQAEQMAELCHGNALLLSIIAALIASERCSIQDALADAKAGGPLSLLEGARYAGARFNSQIKHANRWLLEHLTDTEQEAIAKLSLFRGSISRENVMLMMGSAFIDLEFQDPSMLSSDLRDAFILQIHNTSPAGSGQCRFNMHPIIWDFACRMRAAQPAEQQTASWHRFVQCMLSEAKRLAALSPSKGLNRLGEAMQILADEVLNFQGFCQELAAMVAAGKQAGMDLVASGATLEILGRAMSDLGHYAEAEQLLRQALDLTERVHGSKHPDTQESRSNLARALSNMGQHAEAVQLLRQVLESGDSVLELEEDIFWEDWKHLEALGNKNNLAVALRAMGQYAEAVILHREVLQLREQMLGCSHPNTCASRNNLAVALRAMGQHSEAEQLHREVLDLRMKVLGHEHPEMLVSRSNLAVALRAMGQHAEAAQLHRQVLDLRELMLGHEHPSTLTSRNNLAVALCAMGQHDEAVQLNREVLEQRVNVLGHEHPDTLASKDNMAIALHEMGKHAEAMQLHRQVPELYRKVLGREHPDTLTGRNNLANTLHAMGQLAEAMQLHRDVLELREKVLGREHPSTLGSRNNWATALFALGRYGEAAQLHREVLELFQKLLGHEHPNTLSSRNNLANALRAMGKHAEALQLHREVLELREKLLGCKHPDTLVSRNNLAVVLRVMGQHSEALQLHGEVLLLRVKVLGHEHPDTLGSRSNLAVALRATGQHAEAVQLHRQVLDLRELMLGHKHPSTLNSRNNLASALCATGRHAEAVQLHREVLDLRENVLGHEHPSTLGSRNNLAGALCAMGRHAEAAQLHRQVLEAFEKVLGRKHPNTLSSKNNLANALRAMSQNGEAVQLHRKVLDLWAKILGHEYNDMVASRNTLAEVLNLMGQRVVEGQVHRQELELRDKLRGYKHPSTSGGRNNLACAQSAMCKHAEAGKLHMHLLGHGKAMLSHKCPNMLAGRSYLADALNLVGQRAEAAQLHSQERKLWDKVLSCQTGT